MWEWKNREGLYRSAEATVQPKWVGENIQYSDPILDSFLDYVGSLGMSLVPHMGLLTCLPSPSPLLPTSPCIFWCWIHQTPSSRSCTYQTSRTLMSPRNLQINYLLWLCTRSSIEEKGATRLVLVSEPDPRKIEKGGLAHRLGWKCTLCPVWRRTSDWLLISILMCIYWKC